jgi:thermostable 8-oxoguanine DNA glycosylase
LYKEIPNVANRNIYFEVEKDFWLFSEKVGITIDELDLLFWSYETGEIIK